MFRMDWRYIPGYEGFYGLSLDAPSIVNVIDHFKRDGDGLTQDFPDVTQKLFDVFVTVFPAPDDLDEDEVSAHLGNLELLEKVQVFLDVHGEGVEDLQG